MARKRGLFFNRLSAVLRYLPLGLFVTLTFVQSNSATSSTVSAQAQALTEMGHRQLYQGHPEAAFKNWEAAYKAYQQMNDSLGMTGSLINQSLALQSQGLYKSACNNLLIALKLKEKICSSSLQQEEPLEQSLLKLNDALQKQPLKEVNITGLRNLGDVLRLMGKPEASLIVLQKALDMSKTLNLSNTIINNQLLLSLADTQQSLYIQAKDKYQLTDEPGAKGKAFKQAETSINNSLLSYQEVATKAPRFLAIQGRLNQLSLLLELKKWITLTNSQNSSQTQLIQPLLTEIISKAQDFQDLGAIDSVYARLKLANNIMQFYQKDEEPLLIALSTANQALSIAEKLNNRRLISYANGTIGKIYGRLGQTLKSQEYLELGMELAQSVKAWDIAYQWQWELGRLYQQLKQSKKVDEAYTAAINSLEQVRGNIVSMNPDIQFNFKEKVEPVYHEYMKFLLAPEVANYSRAIAIQEKLRIAEIEDFLKCGKINTAFNEKEDTTLVDLPPIVYLFRIENQIQVLVNVDNRFHSYTLDLKSVDDSTMNLLRIARNQKFVRTQSLGYLSYSNNIYNLLIAPIRRYLPPNGKLVFITDSYFQNIPFKMLSDGKKFLLESYTVELASSLRHLKAQLLEQKSFNLLFAGMSEVGPVYQHSLVNENFQALPEVQQEIKNIQKSIPSISSLLNDKFTIPNFQKTIKAEPFSIFHISTHAQFSSDPDNTFLLTWNQLLKVQDLKSLIRNREYSIDLLVLSACETAKGDKRSALGIAGVAAQAGARSTLATLWLVDANATAVLMGEFYKNLKKGLPKAEALRQAQLSLMHSDKYSHPYYWGSFILVGGF